jgi:hypothetical protein
MKPRAKLPKSGGTKATTKPANKGKPKGKAQPPVKARGEEPHATTSEEAAATTSTAVTAPVEDAPECPNAFAKAEEEEERNDANSAEEGEKGADGAQTRARMLQRHKQELRVGPLPLPLSGIGCPTGLHVLIVTVATLCVARVVLCMSHGEPCRR